MMSLSSIGRIRAVQLDYSDAHKNLLQVKIISDLDFIYSIAIKVFKDIVTTPQIVQSDYEVIL